MIYGVLSPNVKGCVNARIVSESLPIDINGSEVIIPRTRGIK
jgi:hypothetical protein